jgi:hypothetical protein
MYAVRNWLVGGVIVMVLYLHPAICRGANIPDSISLDSLVQLYEKVEFDHAKHITLTKDCAACHHHTTGTLQEDRNCIRCHRNSNETNVVACKGCHSLQPFSATTLREKDLKTYHRDKPGLKAAYHLNCVGCHEKNGGPTGCKECHSRTKDGDKLYNSGEFAPKKAAGGHSSGH